MYKLLFFPMLMWSAVFVNKPDFVKFEDIQAHSLTIRWNDTSDNEQGFKIFRDKKLIYITKENVTSYTDEGLSADTNYSYTIKATNISRHKLLPPKADGKIYFGAESGYEEDTKNTSEISNKISDFDTKSQKPTMWAYIADNWSYWDERGEEPYPKNVVQAILERDKKVVFMRMVPYKNIKYVSPMDVAKAKTCKIDKKCIDDTYKLHDIATSASIEAMIRDWARGAKRHFEEAKADGKPFYLLIDFCPEMNGYWFPWSDLHQSANDYKEAYRKFVDIFRQEKVPHVTWVFHPDLTNEIEWNWLGSLSDFPNHTRWAKPASYYPGDDYVDWIGFSRYGKDDELSDIDDYPSFSSKMDQFDLLIKSLNATKPIMIAEIAVTENPYDPNAKKVWFEEMFTDIKSRPRIKAFSYWNESWGTETNIGTSTTSLKAFSDGVKDSVFVNEPNISFVGE